MMARRRTDPMGGILIIYRREDTGGRAGRLCDRLTARFGERVLMDIQDIGPGQSEVSEDFAAKNEALSGTKAAMLALSAEYRVDAIVYPARLPGSDRSRRHDAQGLPITIAFFGPAFSEATLPGHGYDFEQATKARMLPTHAGAPSDTFTLTFRGECRRPNAPGALLPRLQNRIRSPILRRTSPGIPRY
jgi:hypothetical protein